jgi:hypothetical protein
MDAPTATARKLRRRDEARLGATDRPGRGRPESVHATQLRRTVPTPFLRRQQARAPSRRRPSRLEQQRHRARTNHEFVLLEQQRRHVGLPLHEHVVGTAEPETVQPYIGDRRDAVQDERARWVEPVIAEVRAEPRIVRVEVEWRGRQRQARVPACFGGCPRKRQRYCARAVVAVHRERLATERAQVVARVPDPAPNQGAAR